MIKSRLLHGLFLTFAVCGILVMDVSAQTGRSTLEERPVPRSTSRSSAQPSAAGKMSAASMTSEETVAAQNRKAMGIICGNPKLPCRTEFTFQPFDLPFRVPNTAVLWETELFYAVILKSKPALNDDCDIFFSETERLSVQELFPDKKVFASRCADPENLFYTNTKRDHRILAVYAGKSLAEANRTLAAVKATGKFAGANVRRMRTGFNGT